MNIKRLAKKTETYIVIISIVFALIVQVKSGQFFTGNNIVDLLRSFTIPAMFCIGEMMVIISGGVDCSFPAIASLSMYFVCMKLENTFSNPWMFMAVAMLLGLLMGAVNGVIVAKYRFPTMIVTLGTSSIFFGILQGVLGSREYPLTQPLSKLGQMKLFSAQNPISGLNSDMPVHFLFMIALVVIGWFIMNKTMLGRGIYAIGGDEIAAKRAGFNVFGIKMFIYCFSGTAAGLIGVLRASMMLTVNPNNLIGMDMDVIAACVLGGVSITGGKGGVAGALLGTALMTMVSNSLILLGINTQWQRVFTGLIIIIGTGITAIQEKNRKKRLVIEIGEA